jgi:hypothetical protein
LSSAFTGDRFAEALALVVELQTGVRRKLPAEAPTDFITPSWHGFVHPQQTPERLPYELYVLAILRERLRLGEVFVPGSRKFADLESYLIPAAQWLGLRGEVLRQLGLPEDPSQRLHARLAELGEVRLDGATELANGAKGQFGWYPALPSAFDALFYLHQTSASQSYRAAHKVK